MKYNENTIKPKKGFSDPLLDGLGTLISDLLVSLILVFDLTELWSYAGLKTQHLFGNFCPCQFQLWHAYCYYI